MTKRKRTEAQIEAERAYEAKRPGGQIAVKFTDAELKIVDAARGDMTRAAWLKSLAKKALKLNR